MKLAFQNVAMMPFKENLVIMFCFLFILVFISGFNGTFACCRGTSNAKDYQLRGLYVHNKFRQHHGAPEMKLNDELNRMAEKCARWYANITDINHKCPYKVKVGENLFMVYGWNNINAVEKTDDGIKSWYNEIDTYDFENPSFNHYTQLIWDTSVELGVGLAVEKGKSTVMVALYRPPGNSNGAFKKHAHRPKSPQKPYIKNFSETVTAGIERKTIMGWAIVAGIIIALIV